MIEDGAEKSNNGIAGRKKTPGRNICACAHEMHMTSVQPFDDWHRDICACAHEMHSLQQFR